MSRLKKMVCMGLVVSLMALCLAGCLQVDMGVVVKEDGTASLTSKIMIEEEAYLSLASFDSAENENGDMGSLDGIEDAGEGTEEEVPGEDESVDLSEFQKETIDGEVYYSFEETVEVASYEELEQMLIGSGDEDGVDLLSDVKVTKDEGTYSFHAVTTAMEDADSSMGTDWVKLTLTVTLPGEIVETSGEQIDENTVRFKLDDFAEEHELTVVSEVPAVSVGILVGAAVCGVVLVGCVVFFVARKRRS